MALTSKALASSDSACAPCTVFADLRRRNERAAQVAQMLADRRTRQIEQAIRAQLRQRIHQAH